MTARNVAEEGGETRSAGDEEIGMPASKTRIKPKPLEPDTAHEGVFRGALVLHVANIHKGCITLQGHRTWYRFRDSTQAKPELCTQWCRGRRLERVASQ